MWSPEPTLRSCITVPSCTTSTGSMIVMEAVRHHVHLLIQKHLIPWWRGDFIKKFSSRKPIHNARLNRRHGVGKLQDTY